LKLRPYQETAVEDLRVVGRTGRRHLILHMPTGGGKTVVAAEVIRSALQNKDKKVLFVAPRRELVYQCVDKLEAMGVEAGIIMAKEMPDISKSVQVATLPTLHARAVRGNKIALPKADLVVWDECHLSIAPTYMHILDVYKASGAFQLGLTATPARGDGRGLGERWDEIVTGSTVAELVKGGSLVPQRYFAPTKPDLAGVKISMGDYQENQLQDAMDKPKLVGDVVSNWIRLGEDRQTVVFASGVRHSIHLRDRFREEGISAEHLDGKTPLDERADILRRVNAGEIKVLCNCFVLTFGWDCPPVSCAVVARPSKSLVLYLQMCGRVLRPYPGTEDALIIDHAGIVAEHGFIDEDFPWSLDGKERLKDRIAANPKRENKAITCPSCSFIFRPAAECPRCGWKPAEKRGDAVDFLDGDLFEIDKKKRQKKTQFTKEEKQSWLSQLIGHAITRGYKPGWASHKYREKFGVWPRGLDDVSRPCSPEVRAWVKSRQIAYAKRRQQT
jgi:superfamily II DNA or RNA helicase